MFLNESVISNSIPWETDSEMEMNEQDIYQGLLIIGLYK